MTGLQKLISENKKRDSVNKTNRTGTEENVNEISKTNTGERTNKIIKTDTGKHINQIITDTGKHINQIIIDTGKHINQIIWTEAEEKAGIRVKNSIRTKCSQRVKDSISVKGSFTVEASVLMCIMLVILIGFLYMTMLYHDKCILDGCARLAAEKGKLYLIEDQLTDSGKTDWDQFWKKGLYWRIGRPDSAEEIERYAVSLAEGRLLLCKQPAFHCEAGTVVTEITYTAESKINRIAFFSLPVSISGTISVSWPEEEEILRVTKAILDGK